MRRFALLAICVLQIAVAAQAVGQYSVIGPGTIHSKGKYNVAVTAYHNTEPTQIKVGITGPSYNETKIVELATDELKNVEFDVPALDKGDYNLTAEGVSGLVFKNTTKLNYADVSPYIKIQTDKGTYKPGDEVKFRVLFMDENLKPARPNEKTVVWFEDGKRNRIKEYKNFEVVKGVYTEKFKISEFPVLGDWRLMVSNAESYPQTVYFDVDKYVLPKYTVKVEATDDVAVQDGDMQVVVRANYTYDKPFNGKVTLLMVLGTYYSNNEDGVKKAPALIKTTDMVNGKAKFDLDVRSYEQYMPEKRSSYYMEITATVEEPFTAVKINGSANSRIYPYRYNMVCVDYTNCSSFKADEETEVPFKITRVDNAEIKDTKSIVKLSYKESISEDYSYRGSDEESTTAKPVTPKIEEKVHVFEARMNESAVVVFKVSLPNLEEFKGFTHYYDCKIEYAGEEQDQYRTYQYRKPKFVEPPKPAEEEKKYFKLHAHYKENEYSAPPDTDVTVTVNSSVPLKYFIHNIIGRGNVLHSERITLPVEAQVYNYTVHTTFVMSPNSYIYIYYVDEQGEFHYAEFLLRTKVELQNKIDITVPEKVKPGEDVSLRIKTAPNSFVGLLAVDQSVLLLKENNDISADDFQWQLNGYSTYTPHQGGYSYYPGQQSGAVTLTNADYFYNWTAPSYGKNRKLGIGPSFAHGLRTTYTTQYATTPMVLNDPVAQDGVALSPAGGSAGNAVDTRVRRNFDETWIFMDIENTETEEFTWNKQIPDTITSWMLSGFSLNAEKGLGVTKERSKIITFQPFFISIRLPYSVKRGEVINVPALVFNYLDKALDVMVTLDNTDGEYEFTDVSNEVINEEKRTKVVQVAANSAAGVAFMLRPKIIGNIMLKLTAVSPIAGDAVHRTLKVVPEGVTEYANRAYFVNLRKEPDFKDTFELALPAEIVPDSDHVEFTVVGDLLGPLLNNLEHLVRMPTGCAEQTISSMIPNYLVLDYFKSINKLTPALESQITRNLEQGYQRILTYRNEDGSFASFGFWLRADGEKHLNGSTWLTAYILKSLGEANKYVNVDQKVLDEGFVFLASKQAENGSFVENGDVFYAAQNHHITLTASAILAFIQNETIAKTYETQLNKGLKYILDNLEKTENLHAKTFATYTLHLAKHKMAPELAANLKTLAKTDDDRMWWSETEKPTGHWWRWAFSKDVEITSYMLLTLLDLETESVDSVLPIIKWLVAQRNSYGGFVSTSDTVVGLKALIKFAQKSGYEPAIMEIDYASKGGREKKDTVHVTEENGLLMQIHELPPKTKAIDFHAKGKGAALIQISYQYNILEKEKKPSFKVQTVINKDTPKLKLELEVCVEYVDEGQASNMAVLEVSLPSGYTADDESFKDIQEIDRVRLVETKNDETVIVVYFESLPKGEVKCLPIAAYKAFAVAMQKPNPVVLYDYYDTSKKATEYYEVSSKVCDICEGDEECLKACG